MPPYESSGKVGIGLVVASIVLVFLVNCVQLADFDIFLHVAVGDWVVEHLQVPRTGLFSATRGDAPWVDNEWGFQVLAATAHRLQGVSGLVLLSALLPTIAAALVALTLLRRGMSPGAAALGVGLMAIALGSLHLRPQRVSEALLAAFLLGVTELTDGRSRVPVFVLPVLGLLWANLHGGFILGLAVVAIPAVVESLRRLAGRPPAYAQSPLWTCFALSSLAVFVNPYGWRQVIYPIEYALHPGMTAFNLEWQPTVLAQEPRFALLLGVAVLVLAISPRRPTLADLGLLCGFTVLALKAHRQIPLAAIVIPCAVAPSAAALARAAVEHASRLRGVVLQLGVAAVLAGAWCWTGTLWTESPFHFDRSLLLPVESADFLAKHRPPGKLFNECGWGDFLIDRFRPESIVFVDGRNDLYGEAFMAEYMQIMAGGPEAERILDKYGIGYALLGYDPSNASLIRRLLEGGWVCVHRSNDFVPVIVLVRNTPDARPLIESFGMPLAPL